MITRHWKPHWLAAVLALCGGSLFQASVFASTSALDDPCRECENGQGASASSPNMAT